MNLSQHARSLLPVAPLGDLHQVLVGVTDDRFHDAPPCLALVKAILRQGAHGRPELPACLVEPCQHFAIGFAGDGLRELLAGKLLDRGFFISFSGIVTFRSAEALRECARKLPHDRVLIETDTPYLAPVPFRGRDNEPAYVVKVAELLAALWGIAVETVAGITTANFDRAFSVTVPR